MKQDYRHALMLGFDRGLFALPSSGQRCAVFNAVALPELDENAKSGLLCEQALRPLFLDLEKSGYSVVPELDSGVFATAIVFAGRNRRLNEHNMIRAWNQCETGGEITVAGDKTSGIASLRKWVSARTEIVESFSKHHAVVFSVKKADANWQLQDLSVSNQGYHIAEGMFSADGPDKGSMLLAEHFDNRIANRVADFGAGWGYLSAELLKRSDRVSSLDLYEADWHSLQAAKTNLSKSDVSIRYHWCDIVSEYKKHVLDWVIMNPPFHTGRAAEPALGQKFIQIAASTLPSGGRLLMVANRNLPYEQTLGKVFRAYETLETRDGFKVIEARK